MYKRIFTVFLLLSSISLVLTVPAPVSFFFGVLQTFFLPGFVLLLFLEDEKRHWFGDLAVAVLLSPVILTFSVLLIFHFTGSVDTSLRIFLSIAYSLLGLSFVTGRIGRTDEKRSLPLSIPVICIAFGGLIAAMYFINPTLMKRSDSWYHASLISEILTRGIPPMEPFLADFPVKYMWFYHFFIASVIKSSGLRIFPAMALFNVMAAFSFPYLLARYASFFSKKPRDITIASLLAIAGLGSVSWVLWPVQLGRALFGEVRGFDEIARIFGTVELDSANVIFSLTPYGTWMVNLPDKFITITVFGYSLGLFILSLLTVLAVRSEDKFRIKKALLLMLSISGSLIFHVVTGVTLLCSIIGSLFLIFLGYWLLSRKKIPVVQLLLMLLTAVAAFALAFPLLKRVDMSSGGGNLLAGHLHLGWKNILTILVPLSILFCPLRDAVKKMVGRHHKRHHEVLISWAICLLVLNLFVDLPSVNESKFIFPLFLLVGTPIFVEIARKTGENRGAKRRGLILLILFLFLLPLILTFRGFLMNRPVDPIEISRCTADEKECPVFEWIRENTPLNSLIIENNRYHLMPVLARRRNFYSDRGIIHVLGYGEDKMSRYERIEREIFSGGVLSPESIETLKSIGYDIYIAVREEDLNSTPSLDGGFGPNPDLFESAYKDERIELYRLKKPVP